MENPIARMNQGSPNRISAQSDHAIQAAGNAILYGGVIFIFLEGGKGFLCF